MERGHLDVETLLFHGKRSFRCRNSDLLHIAEDQVSGLVVQSCYWSNQMADTKKSLQLWFCVYVLNNIK